MYSACTRTCLSVPLSARALGFLKGKKALCVRDAVFLYDKFKHTILYTMYSSIIRAKLLLCIICISSNKVV